MKYKSPIDKQVEQYIEEEHSAQVLFLCRLFIEQASTEESKTIDRITQAAKQEFSGYPDEWIRHAVIKTVKDTSPGDFVTDVGRTTETTLESFTLDSSTDNSYTTYQEDEAFPVQQIDVNVTI